MDTIPEPQVRRPPVSVLGRHVRAGETLDAAGFQALERLVERGAVPGSCQIV